VPTADRHQLRPWSNAIVALYEPVADTATEDAAITAAADFDAYLRDLLAQRRREPGDDLLSALAADDGERLTDDEVVGTAILLLNAGHEASVNVAANGLVALLTHPGELARVLDDPTLVVPAVEEAIRWDTPLSLFDRVASADLEVAGQRIAAGERVGLLLAAANRDPAAFADPDAFDVARTPNPHVGFGAGIHFCLGAPLARLELRIALDRVLTRFPGIALAGEPVRQPTFQFRGHASVPVHLGAPAAGPPRRAS
jgi:cytochrome P450